MLRKMRSSKFAAWLLLGLCTVVGVVFLIGVDPERPRDVSKGEAPVDAAFGWIDDPAAVRDVVDELKHPTFAGAAAELVRDVDETKDALLFEFVKKVNDGKHPKAHNQNPVGCCVSEGWSSAVEYIQCVDIVLRGAALEYKPISHSFIYGTARVDIGKGRLGSSDGAVGAWAAKAVSTIGVVTCEEAGEDNYGPHFAREWGSRGVPAKLKELASKHKVKTVSQVRSAKEALAALQNGYPVPVCFRTGFAMTRDAAGFCRAQGQWGHCQLCGAYRGDKKAFLLIQSWGDGTPKGPLAKDQPDYSFWITWETMDRICAENDSFALSNFEGFPGRARDIDWFVHRRERGLDAPLLAKFLTRKDGRYAFSEN